MAKKHSKFKNTGILFELLVRQIASDILSSKESKADKIIREFFKTGKELNKELRLYQTLIKDKFENENHADKFIDKVIENRKKIDNKLLKQEKYELVKAIMESYNLDDFFKSRVQEYKLLASAYKIFEDAIGNNISSADTIISRNTLIEHITAKKITEQSVRSKITEEYEKLDKDLRLLAYKQMLSRFNERYENLNENQKTLLRQFINNVTNSTTLKDYLNEEIPKVKARLVELSQKIDDQTIRIKISGIANNLNELMKAPIIEDENILTMMQYYELVKELETI